MSKQKDYIGDDVPEHIREFLKTKGIHREIIEVRNLEAVTELAIESVKSLKNQNLVNLIFLIIGSLLTVFTTSLFDNKKNEELKQLITNQNKEIVKLKKEFERNNKVIKIPK